MIEQISTIILVFLGLYVGLLIGWLAKEELKDGKKYLIILQKIIFILTVFLLFYHFDWWIVGFVLLIVFSIALFKLEKDYHKLLYYILAVVFFFSFYNSDALLAVPAMVFFYGLPTGSIFYHDAKNKKFCSMTFSLLKGYFWFLIIAIVLFVIRIFI